MAHYIILSKLTDEGRKTIKNNPGRILEVNKELEKMGVKIKESVALSSITINLSSSIVFAKCTEFTLLYKIFF